MYPFATLSDPRHSVVAECAAHAQMLKDLLGHEIGIGTPSGVLDDFSSNFVPPIVVSVLSSEWSDGL